MWSANDGRWRKCPKVGLGLWVEQGLEVNESSRSLFEASFGRPCRGKIRDPVLESLPFTCALLSRASALAGGAKSHAMIQDRHGLLGAASMIGEQDLSPLLPVGTLSCPGFAQLFFSQHALSVEIPGCFASEEIGAPKKKKNLSGNPDFSLVFKIFRKALARPTFLSWQM